MKQFILLNVIFADENAKDCSWPRQALAKGENVNAQAGKSYSVPCKPDTAKKAGVKVSSC